jgi:hypothetical protein
MILLTEMQFFPQNKSEKQVVSRVTNPGRRKMGHLSMKIPIMNSKLMTGFVILRFMSNKD